MVAMSKQYPIRVAIVESDPLRAVGLRTVLENEKGLELTSISQSEIRSITHCDIVLLGNHSGQNALNILSAIKPENPSCRIIITGVGVDPEYIISVLAAGASGYVDECNPVELARAVKAVHEGSIWAPRRVLSAFIERASAASLPPNRSDLTDREKQVLGMLVTGMSNKEIASPLGIEERTVKAHVGKLMRKMGVQNRIELSVHAITHALIPVGSPSTSPGIPQ